MGQSPLLQLPFDIRSVILHYTLIAGPFQTTSLVLGPRVRTLVQVKANRRDQHAPFRSNGIALLTTCRQLHEEGIDSLYKHLAIDLDYNTEEDNGDRTIDFLQKIGPDNRARIQWIQLRCYSASSPHALPLCEWRHLLHTIASGCLSLKQCILICPTDPEEQRDFRQTCNPSSQWIKAVLPVAHKATLQLQYPDDGPLAADQRFCTEFVPWIAAPEVDIEGLEAAKKENHHTAFPFLALPVHLQRRIISWAVLPPGRIVHPFLSPRVDQTTLTVLPLLLTSQAIRHITEEVIYSEAIFAACLAKYGKHLIAFFHQRTPHQLQLIHRYFCYGLDHWVDRRFDRFLHAHARNAVDMEPDHRCGAFQHPCFTEY